MGSMKLIAQIVAEMPAGLDAHDFAGEFATYFRDDFGYEPTVDIAMMAYEHNLMRFCDQEREDR